MKNVFDNAILNSDAYKMCHFRQYPKNTQIVYSYLESRGGVFDYTVFFGLQYFLKNYLSGKIVNQKFIDEADEFCQQVFGTKDFFNREGWEYILNKYEGALPIRIKSVIEGSVVPTKNVLFTIENTDEKVPWLTNFLETLLLEVWYPTTVATLSRKIKERIKTYADKTGCKLSPFHLNDFGFRGVSSPESAGLGGAAHLINFLGTDNFAGIKLAMGYYNSGVCGHSVFATEHSTTTIYGRENECKAYETFIDECPEGIISLVSDSYNIYEAIKMFGTTLKDKILARGQKTGFAKLVVRPDSGDPVKMSLEVIQNLEKYFGTTVNEKGYKTLNPKVGVIYGDSVNYKSIGDILDNITNSGYSTDNILFGCGGKLLQDLNRDTLKFATKCCWAKVGGEGRDVYKDPITDQGKISKKGRLKLVIIDGVYTTVNEDQYPELEDQLVTVYENGELLIDQKFEDIRKNAELK